jgi:flagellin
MQINNYAGLINQSFLNKSAENLKSSIDAMSSGLKSNSDNSTALSMASKMTSQIKGLSMSSRNSSDAVSLAQTAEGAMSSQVSQLQEARALAVQASSSTLNQADRDSIDTQAQAMFEEMDEISQNTNFNGKKLLNGSVPDINIQSGANTGDTTQMKMSNTSNAALGLASIDLTSQSSSQTAIEDIDKALESLQSSSSEMGTYRDSFERRIESNKDNEINTERARARMIETDYAEESANLIKEQIMQKTQLAMRSHSQVSAQQVLSLLK